MNNFNDSSNNINSNHKLINLPHILLNRIINLLDNIDRVCFTLVCKRWFKERDSYLSFDSTYLIKNVDLKYISNFYLQSYKKQIEFSRDIKSDCSLFFSTKEESELLTYDNLFDCNDYIIDLEKIGKEEIEIPKSVENIYFSDSFNSSIEPLTKSLADSNVRYLCFGSNFNQPIKQHTLPSNIKQLNFGMDYNQEFEVGSLPNSLEKLILGRNYNQPLIPNVLPATLKYLSFRLHFDAPIIHGSLPANLEHLEFGRNYCTKFIAEYLPKKLKTINNFSINYLDQLPPSVTTISFARPPTPAPLSEDDIPPTIVNLHFGYYAQPLEENVIPKTLKVLDLGFYYHYPLEKNQLPDTLEELNLGEIYNSPIKPGVLPKSLKKLTLSVNFSHKLEIGSIPYGVESLTFNHMYYHEIQKGIIPDTVTDIIFKSECCTLKHDTLPNSIKSLNIENYELKLPDNAIPPSVETVTISIIFFKDNTMESIPSNVKTIRLYYNYLYYDIKRIGNNNGVDYFLILGDMTTLQGGFVTSNFFNYYLYPKYVQELKLD